MPYATKEAKRAHNDRYHAEHKVRLIIARMQKRGQTRIGQRVYDQIKDEAPPEWLQTLTIIQGKLKATPTAAEEEKQRIRQGRAKISVDRAKEMIDTMDVADSTKRNMKSMVNSLVKLLCIERNDFLCIYTKINAKVDLIKREYKNPSTMIQFMKTMIDKHESIRNRVPQQNRNILNRRAASEATTQEAKKIETTKQRDAETNWAAEYERIVQHEAATDELKAIKSLYVDGVRNDKGYLTMIPRNYYHSMKVVNNQRQTTKTDNFYIKSSGTVVINDYKTKKQYGMIKYKLPKTVRSILNRYAGNKETLFEGSADVMNTKVRKAIGSGIDDYRRIMKHKFESDGISVEAIAKAMAHAPTTGNVSY